MTFPIDVPDRRGFLKLSAMLSGMTVMSSSVFAAETKPQTALRFLIEFKGKKFGVQIMPFRGGMNLVSMREMSGNRRFIYAFNFRGPDTNSVPIKIGNKKYQVIKRGNWIATNVPGLKIGPPEPPAAQSGQNVPAALRSNTRGVKEWLAAAWDATKGALKAAAAVVVVVVSIAIGSNGAVSLGGKDEVVVETTSDGKVNISVSIGGITIDTGSKGSSSNFMAPPPGVPEDPNVWY